MKNIIRTFAALAMVAMAAATLAGCHKPIQGVDPDRIPKNMSYIADASEPEVWVQPTVEVWDFGSDYATEQYPAAVVVHILSRRKYDYKKQQVYLPGREVYIRFVMLAPPGYDPASKKMPDPANIIRTGQEYYEWVTTTKRVRKMVGKPYLTHERSVESEYEDIRELSMSYDSDGSLVIRGKVVGINTDYAIECRILDPEKEITWH